MTDPGRPSTWVRFKPSLCHGCAAGCTLPVEATAADLVRIGILSPDEAPKKAARRLAREGLVASYRARTGLFTLAQRNGGDCVFLGRETRRCTIYDRRPDTCRRFPEIGPRPGFCPALKTEKGTRPPVALERVPFTRLSGD